MMSNRIWYLLGLAFAFSLGFQLNSLGWFMLFSPRLIRRHPSAWKHDTNDVNVLVTTTANYLTTTQLPESSTTHVDQQRYLVEPEVTSLRLSSSFNGTEQCPSYRRHSKSHPFQLNDDTRQYFQQWKNVSCLTTGTRSYTSTDCTCRYDWYGKHCSIPGSVWYSDLQHSGLRLLRPRYDRPARRLLYAMPFNIEFAMLEARLAEFGDVVDVFLILESNYTAYGRHKPLRLLEMLCQGKYRQYAHKIVHVWLDYFPKEAKIDGWASDSLHRDYIGQHGLRHLVSGHRQDDLFVLTDADELPSRDTLIFLKTHDGYPEPVVHSYSHRIYGFYWKSRQDTRCPSAVSVGVLTHILQLKAMLVRKGAREITKRASELNTYLKSHSNVTIRQWTLGNFTHPSGWHCSWCFDPEGIQNKLTSAVNADFPRWGDYPDKVKLGYIQGLVGKGMWFDNKDRYQQRTHADRNYAPEYILQHRDVYRNLLENRWRVTSLTTTSKTFVNKGLSTSNQRT